MIDLHTHVLPGIDDGADDLATAVEMCRLARAAGCTALVATPHQRTEHWANDEPRELERLRREVEAAAGSDPRLLLGAEVRVDSLLLEELGRPDRAGILGLADSRYLLLELDRFVRFERPLALTDELRVAGWRPVYAHPELIPWLAGDPDLLGELVAAGALLQITAASLTGAGRPVRNLCRWLLDEDLVHFVASDAHGVAWRPPGLAQAHEVLTRGWGAERADRLTRHNPAAVLSDRPLAAAA
jgi:protein-tyrosine phosphatase